MKKLAKYILASFLIIAALSSYSALAQDFIHSPIPKPETLPGPELTTEGIGETRAFTERILPNIAVGLIGFAGAASLVFLIVAGVRYTLTFGEEEAAEKAKMQIINALFGFLIALLAFTIVSITANIDFGEEDRTIRFDEGEELVKDATNNAVEELYDSGEITEEQYKILTEE